MSNKPICIEVGDKLVDIDLNYKTDFTTNKNYLGHREIDDVPIYYDCHLKKGEIKEIMTQEFKNLPEGKYLAKVEQIIRKHGKDADGNDDNTKDIISIELNVKGHDDRFYYKSLCIKGYSEQQVEIANKELKEIMEKFNIDIIEDLVGQEVILTSKVNDKGFTNLSISPKVDFFDWSTIITFDGEAKFPCTLKKFYKGKVGNKYIFVVKANVNGKIIDEYVCYDLDKPFKQDGINYIFKSLKLDINADCDKDDLNKELLLVVKRVSSNDRVFFNKRLGFPKKPQRKPEKW